MGVAAGHVSGRGLPGVLAHCLEGVVEKLSLRGRAPSVVCPKQNKDSCLYLLGESEGRRWRGREREGEKGGYL